MHHNARRRKTARKSDPPNSGISVEKNRQTEITHFDAEKARLHYSFPMLALVSMLIVAYGWEMQYHVPLPAILITMFVISNMSTGVLVATTALLTDVNRKEAAAVGAATNLNRYLLSAGGVAVITPLINAIGIGWAATLTAVILIATELAVGVVYVRGFKCRVELVAQELQKRVEQDLTRDVIIMRGCLGCREGINLMDLIIA